MEGPSSTIPLCPQRYMGVLPLPTALAGLKPLRPLGPAQLRPLDVCTFLPVNVSRNQKLLACSITPAPVGLLPQFPSQGSALAQCWVGAHAPQRSKPKSLSFAQPAMSIPPIESSEPKMPTALPGQAELPLPARPGESSTVLERSCASLSCQPGMLPASTTAGQILCNF